MANKRMKKGLSQGREEERKESFLNIAQRFKAMGMSIDQIIKTTGLTEEDTKSIKLIK